MDVPSYMLDKKNWRKKFQIFFIFHRGDPYDFSKKISQKIFLKNHKGPSYEKWKKYEIFFINFFCPKCSLGPVFSYTLTGAVRTERTEYIVEQSDWLLESKVYCWKVAQPLWKKKKQKCTQSMNSKCATFHI